MEKKQNVPELRFQGFSGEWENFSLKDLSKEIIAGGDINKELIKDNGDFPVLGNALTNDGIVGYYDNEFRVKAPAVTITGRGDIGHAIARKVNFTPVIRLLSITTTHDVDFLANGINRSKFIAESTGIPQLTVPQVGKYKINIPSTTNEEERIGKCFVLLEKSVFEGNKKIQKLQQFRQAMLMKLFPLERAAEPELRFRGFSGKWKSKKMKNLGSFLKGKLYSKKDIRASGIPLILYGRLYTQYELVIDDVDTFAIPYENSVWSIGGEVIIPASGETAEDIAIASVVKQKGILLGGDLNIIRPNDTVSSAFLALSISYGHIHNELEKRAQGKSIVHIHNSDLGQLDIRLPSFAEQCMIGQFFENLDTYISLQQKKLEQMQRLKAALLEKMFV